MTLENWLAFCSIAFIAATVPGQAILLVTTHSLQYGFVVGHHLMVCSVICLSAYSLLSQWLKHRAIASKTSHKSLGRLFGSSFIGAGTFLAFVTHSK